MVAWGSKHNNISENTTIFQKTRWHFRKRDISKNTDISEKTTLSENATFQKTRHFRIHDISKNTPFRKHDDISENTTTFQKTWRHFRKHDISKNTTTFQKTQQYFKKHDNISENTTAFQKTPWVRDIPARADHSPHGRYYIIGCCKPTYQNIVECRYEGALNVNKKVAAYIIVVYKSLFYFVLTKSKRPGSLQWQPWAPVPSTVLFNEGSSGRPGWMYSPLEQA